MRIFESDSDITVYCHTGAEEASVLSERLAPQRVSLCVLDDVDWNADLSPWPAAKVFSKGEDFSGKAAAHLAKLKTQINTVESSMLHVPRKRIIAGYSLAGLFALWSVFNCDMFDAAVSASGSMWFDGFTDYVKEKSPADKLSYVYLSLGDKEKAAKNPRMSQVESCTLEIRDELLRKGIDTFFEFNNGGHFNDPTGRLTKGIISAVSSLRK